MAHFDSRPEAERIGKMMQEARKFSGLGPGPKMMQEADKASAELRKAIDKAEEEHRLAAANAEKEDLKFFAAAVEETKKNRLEYQSAPPKGSSANVANLQLGLLDSNAVLLKVMADPKFMDAAKPHDALTKKYPAMAKEIEDAAIDEKIINYWKKNETTPTPEQIATQKSMIKADPILVVSALAEYYQNHHLQMEEKKARTRTYNELTPEEKNAVNWKIGKKYRIAHAWEPDPDKGFRSEYNFPVIEKIHGLAEGSLAKEVAGLAEAMKKEISDKRIEIDAMREKNRPAINEASKDKSEAGVVKHNALIAPILQAMEEVNRLEKSHDARRIKAVKDYINGLPHNNEAYDKWVTESRGGNNSVYTDASVASAMSDFKSEQNREIKVKEDNIGREWPVYTDKKDREEFNNRVNKNGMFRPDDQERIVRERILFDMAGCNWVEGKFNKEEEKNPSTLCSPEATPLPLPKKAGVGRK